MIEAAWRKGGESIIKHITPDQGVVTSLHLTDKYIVVAMDNAKIHVVGDPPSTYSVPFFCTTQKARHRF